MNSRKKKLEQVKSDKSQFVAIYQSRLGDYDRLITELEKLRNANLFTRIFYYRLKIRVIQLQKERDSILGAVQKQLHVFDEKIDKLNLREGSKLTRWIKSFIAIIR